MCSMYSTEEKVVLKNICIISHGECGLDKVSFGNGGGLTVKRVTR